jgi:predicted nucleic acid-binding protein
VTYLLDTCLISELVKPRPSKAVCAWLAEQNEEDMHLSVLTLGEIQKGVSLLPEGRKKARLQSWLDRDLRDRFRGRIAQVTEKVALAWGRVSGESIRRGKPIPVIDALIAATAMALDATVVTRDDTGMRATGVDTFNPWES